MCGIAGGVGKVQWPKKDVLASIQHRGPEANGHFTHNNVYLTHARLAIQDISENGAQPMESFDRRHVLIFNGEIYNHWEIREKLEPKYSFHSTSDTETLLYAFIEYGASALQMLNGIFSLAIFDKIENEIFIARDHLGVKPLYYYRDDEKFLFGSELKTFLLFDIDRSISTKALANYLTFLWSPGEDTPFQSVKKLLPGHYLRFKLSEFSKAEPVKYYQIDFSGRYFSQSEEELIDLLDVKLQQAVKRQLLADVPVGFFLSGGLDSSLIAAIAKELYPEKKFPCFCIASNDAASEGFADDYQYAKLVADCLNVDLHEVESDIDIVRDFDTMIWHLDEPQADPAPLHVLNIAKAARKMGIKVLLGGAGGDDLFSGYRRHKALMLEVYLNRIPVSIREGFKGVVQSFSIRNNLSRRLRKLTADWEKSIISRMAGYFRWLPRQKVMLLFEEVNRNQLKDYDATTCLEQLLNEIPDEHNPLNQMLYWELKSFLVDHNLNYTDKMTMAVGVEARVPYLDLELVEFATKVPPGLKMKRGETKYLLKKVAERYLPQDVIYRPKTGFGAPVRNWITNEMTGMIKERLSPDRIKEQGIFNIDQVWKLIDDNKTGRMDASYSIWSLLAIESWMQQFHKGRKPDFTKLTLENTYETNHTKP